MSKGGSALSVNDFIQAPEVINCISHLEKTFGKNGERLNVSDVLDTDGHQYVNLVQKGGGVLGVALVGYTYILEQMNIRFIRLAGTSAGAINTALMTVIGGEVMITDGSDGQKRLVKGDKKKAKSIELLKALCNLNFFDLVDGHPFARWIIKIFITNKDFTSRIFNWLAGILVAIIGLPVIIFICFTLQYQITGVPVLSKIFFVATAIIFLLVSIIVVYFYILIRRLKNSGFGINPGKFFYDWINERLEENGVYSVSDLVNKASTPVADLYLREDNKASTKGLEGDVTFIASELVTQNKIEFPQMWQLFRKDIDSLPPAGFVRASMSIPLFFESYFIHDIPCASAAVKKAWEPLGEKDPPSTARFVDGGVLSNFPINLFYNPNVQVPRLPSFGIDLDDTKDPKDEFKISAKATPESDLANDKKLKSENNINDAGKNPGSWSLGGYLYRLFNTVRFYYDKDFLLKNAFFKKGIGVVPLKGYGWLNFFMNDQAKKEMFILGAKAATQFLEHFDWQEYKKARVKMQSELKEQHPPER